MLPCLLATQILAMAIFLALLFGPSFKKFNMTLYVSTCIHTYDISYLLRIGICFSACSTGTGLGLAEIEELENY